MEGSAGAAHKKRSGRRAGPTSSNHLILDAARSLFSAEGFEGTTMRAIAHASAVDAALIHHFFLTNDDLPHLLDNVGVHPLEAVNPRFQSLGIQLTDW